jgi:CheY-like chemotaxis protein
MNAKRILLVEDESLQQEVFQIILETEGHMVEVAADASEALQKFSSSQYDLVLTDVRLPGMQGDELARAMKKQNAAQRILLMTGIPLDGSLPEGSKMLLKPFTPKDLLKAVADDG